MNNILRTEKSLENLLAAILIDRLGRQVVVSYSSVLIANVGLF